MIAPAPRGLGLPSLALDRWKGPGSCPRAPWRTRRNLSFPYSLFGVSRSSMRLSSARERGVYSIASFVYSGPCASPDGDIPSALKDWRYRVDKSMMDDTFGIYFGLVKGFILSYAVAIFLAYFQAPQWAIAAGWLAALLHFNVFGFFAAVAFHLFAKVVNLILGKK